MMLVKQLLSDIKRITLLIGCACLLSAYSTVFAADQSPPPNTNSNSIAYTNWLLSTLSRYINNAVNAAVATHKKLIYQPTPNLDSTLLANLSETAGLKKTHEQANQDVLDSLKLILTTSDNSSIVNKAASQVPISISMANKIGAGFNLNSLLDTTNLDPQKAKYAKNYIAFASGLVKPHEVLPPEQILSHTANLGEYKTQLGIATARTSAPLSTLFQLLAERTPQPGLGKLSQVALDKTGRVSFEKGAKIPDSVSALAVSEYNAKRRADNPLWYQKMETATPATVQRETLYTLADIQKSLFDLRVAMERQTALLALMTLQENEAQQRSKLNEDEDAVEKAYNAARSLSQNNR